MKGNYNVVSANEKSISAAGGWLQGGGVAYNSRLYGLGVDNVVDFTVVLPDGSIVLADKCDNTDLFWALRGGKSLFYIRLYYLYTTNLIFAALSSIGGGGTFGVVTHIHYKIHPRTKIVEFNFNIYGRQNLDNRDQRFFGVAIHQWLEFFMKKSVTLDKNWCGGHFGHNYAHLLFCGDLRQAKATFLNDFVDWEQNTLFKDGMRDGVWGSLYSTTIHNSWYEYT